MTCKLLHSEDCLLELQFNLQNLAFRGLAFQSLKRCQNSFSTSMHLEYSCSSARGRLPSFPHEFRGGSLRLRGEMQICTHEVHEDLPTGKTLHFLERSDTMDMVEGETQDKEGPGGPPSGTSSG